jgi:hypothetical protein
MDHWFDELCKQLVPRGTRPRRHVLQGIMANFAMPGSGGSNLAEAQPRLPAAQTRSVVSQGELQYQQVRSYDDRRKVVTTSTTISRGKSPLIKVDVSTANDGSGQVTVSCGREYAGGGTLKMTTQNGTLFQGTMDGRAFTTSRLARSMSDVRFADGGPAPKIAVDPALARAIAALAEKAKKASASSLSVRALHSHRRLSSRDVGQGSPGDGWYEPGETYDAPACAECSDDCGNTCYDKCGFGDWTTWLCGPGCLATAAACDAACYIACWASCQFPGGGCCPVPCGKAFSCCGRGDQCFHGDLCCPGSMVVCNDLCCGPYITTCAPDGFCGCPTGQTVCGDNCCPPDTACCGGECCPTGSNQCCGNNQCCPTGSSQCCGDQCCPTGAPCLNSSICCAPPSNVCGSNCCAPFTVCCGGRCCGVNEICLTDSRTGEALGCCPTSQACGVGGENPVCCAAGEICIDPYNSICGPCPAGQVSCLSMNANGPYTTVCCPSGVDCCNGKCCAPSEVCCTSRSQGFGCHPEDMCIM